DAKRRLEFRAAGSKSSERRKNHLGQKGSRADARTRVPEPRLIVVDQAIARHLELREHQSEIIDGAGAVLFEFQLNCYSIKACVRSFVTAEIKEDRFQHMVAVQGGLFLLRFVSAVGRALLQCSITRHLSAGWKG